MKTELIVAKRALAAATQELVKASPPVTRHYKAVVDALARMMSIDAEMPIEIKLVATVVDGAAQ